MRSLGFGLALVAGASVAGPHAGAQQTPSRQVVTTVQLQDQNDVRSMKQETRGAETNFGTVEITSLKIPARQYRFRLALPQNPEGGGASLSRFVYDERAQGRTPVAVFTGGFLETYSPATPSGLVQQTTAEGRQVVLNQLRPDDPVMRAVVCYSADATLPVAVVPVNSATTGAVTGDCIQAGPFLIKEGTEEPDRQLEGIDATLRFPFAEGQFHRAFLALDEQNNVVVGVTTRISLFALREILRRPREENGFGARTAVALSGTRTAGLLIIAEPGAEIAVGNVRTLLPNAVVIEGR